MRQLDKEIEELNVNLIKMCDLVCKNIKESFDAYQRKNEIAFINDDVVDQYERLIEELCLDILIKERPYSKDLRIISGILKLVSDLERIGDHAEDIMEFTQKLLKEEDVLCDEVSEMLDICLKMVNDSIISYINKDFELAKKVIDQDDVIDRMYIEAIERLIVKDCSRSFAIYTTLVVKYIERICDHSVNIAEWVVYIGSGFYKDKKIF